MSRAEEAEILVPEIRDYHQINREVARLLSTGATRVRLMGVDGQRLLLSGLEGPWSATLEIVGTTGPDLAFGMNAPGVRAIVMGSAGAGAGYGLKAGTVLIVRDAAEGVGARMEGGTVIVAGTAGHRAGYRQSGGRLLVLGPAGRLAGDRRTGGTLLLDAARASTPFGRGAIGFRWLQSDDQGISGLLSAEECRALRESLAGASFEMGRDHPLTRLLGPDREQTGSVEG